MSGDFYPRVLDFRTCHSAGKRGKIWELVVWEVGGGSVSKVVGRVWSVRADSEGPRHGRIVAYEAVHFEAGKGPRRFPIEEGAQGPSIAAQLAAAKAYLRQVDAQTHAAPTMPAEELLIDYVNHRGERRWRRVLPHRIWFGSTTWHKAPQWLMQAEDLDRSQRRDFAMSSILGMKAPGDEEAPRE